MKLVLTVALIALVALASANSESRHHDGYTRVMSSSKTIITSETDGLHRFCIPIGKKPVGVPKSLSLSVPRAEQGFSVKLDTSPLHTFSSPLSSNDKQCKKVSTLFLVREFQNQETFNYIASEISKAGAVSGFIVGPKPNWISVRMSASQFEDIDGAEDVCESILGRKSEKAFEDDHRSSHGTKPRHYRTFMMVRKVLFITGFAVLGLCVLSIIIKLFKKCCCRKPAEPQDNIELGNVQAEDQEARDVALAIERSLADEKKVVEVPQSAAPQFVFLPPQFMPNAPVNGATPYVPMFAPQFMNYSLEERK